MVELEIIDTGGIGGTLAGNALSPCFYACNADAGFNPEKL